MASCFPQSKPENEVEMGFTFDPMGSSSPSLKLAKGLARCSTTVPMVSTSPYSNAISNWIWMMKRVTSLDREEKGTLFRRPEERETTI